MRLDNILFRSGFAPTIPAARQLISHGHILVNNSKINIPSYSCHFKDQITMSQKFKSTDGQELTLKKEQKEYSIPSHLKVTKDDLKIDILDHFNYTEVGLSLNELLIIEYYSRS